jgi:hypothetical protein
VFDLDALWVIPEGVPVDVSGDIERLATRAFRLCTEPDEWIYAGVEGSLPYRFWPHRQPLDGSARWPVGFFPDGDDHLFLSQDVTWGVNALFRTDGCGWGLTVFGQRIFGAFAGHWPKGWSTIVSTGDCDRVYGPASSVAMQKVVGSSPIIRSCVSVARFNRDAEPWFAPPPGSSAPAK